ncbi:unnamed protein product, partial [Rotaria sp. Silwood2]
QWNPVYGVYGADAYGYYYDFSDGSGFYNCTGFCALFDFFNVALVGGLNFPYNLTGGCDINPIGTSCLTGFPATSFPDTTFPNSVIS